MTKYVVCQVTGTDGPAPPGAYIIRLNSPAGPWVALCPGEHAARKITNLLNADDAKRNDRGYDSKDPSLSFTRR